MKMGATQRKVFNFLEANPKQMTTIEIREALSLTEDECLNALRRLFKRGIVLRVISGAEFIWSLAPSDMLDDIKVNTSPI